MTDSFLDNAGGFTPVPDKLVRDYGFEVAYVWGKVWRYCQMQNGACTASHETIAKRAGMSRRTLIDKLNILIEAGYIEDKTPDLKNKPHTYCTKKGEAKIISTMQISHTESDYPTETHKDLGSESDVSMRNLHSDNAKDAQPDTPTMQNLHLKRVSSSSIESSPKKVSKGESPPFGPLTQALADICKLNRETIQRATRQQLFATQEAFYGVGITPAQVLEFDQWRKAHHWSGKKGNDPPSLKQVGEFWGQYEEWVKSGRPDVPAQLQKASQNGTYQRSDKRSIKALEETGESLANERTIDIYTNEYVYPDGHREPVPPVPRVQRPGLLSS